MQALESLDWTRYRPTVVIIEDFDQFANGARPAISSSIRTFMLERDYGVAAQTLYNFFYVDRRQIGPSDRQEGFRLLNRQFYALGFRTDNAHAVTHAQTL